MRTLAFGIGIAVAVGLILVHAATLVPRPPPSYGTPPPPQYQAIVTALGMAGLTVVDLAVGLSIGMALHRGLSRAETSEVARRGMFLFATGFLIAWLVMSMFAVLWLSNLIRYA